MVLLFSSIPHLPSSLFDDNIEVVEQGHGLGQGEAGIGDGAGLDIDGVVGRPAEIDLGQVGLEEYALVEISILEIPASQVSLNEINFFGLTFDHCDFRQFEQSEIRVVEQTLGEAQFYYLLGLGPVDTDGFALNEPDFSKLTIHGDNVADVALNEFTVQKAALLKSGAAKTAIIKLAVFEDSGLNVFSVDGELDQFFLIVRLFEKSHVDITVMTLRFVFKADLVVSGTVFLARRRKRARSALALQTPWPGTRYRPGVRHR